VTLVSFYKERYPAGSRTELNVPTIEQPSICIKFMFWSRIRFMFWSRILSMSWSRIRSVSWRRTIYVLKSSYIWVLKSY